MRTVFAALIDDKMAATILMYHCKNFAIPATR
jgi:hypothetical protein